MPPMVIMVTRKIMVASFLRWWRKRFLPLYVTLTMHYDEMVQDLVTVFNASLTDCMDHTAVHDKFASAEHNIHWFMVIVTASATLRGVAPRCKGNTTRWLW